MNKAIKIEITRGEGRRDMDFDTHVFNTWAEANAHIAKIVKTVEGHSDKVDFAVYFEDTHSYKGTMCVKSDEEETLTDHIRDFLAFEMGISKPAHLSEAQYADFIDKREELSPDHMEEIRYFAANYKIG